MHSCVRLFLVRARARCYCGYGSRSFPTSGFHGSRENGMPKRTHLQPKHFLVAERSGAPDAPSPISIAALSGHSRLSHFHAARELAARCARRPRPPEERGRSQGESPERQSLAIASMLSLAYLGAFWMLEALKRGRHGSLPPTPRSRGGGRFCSRTIRIGVKQDFPICRRH
jgi:hypothetical protein